MELGWDPWGKDSFFSRGIERVLVGLLVINFFLVCMVIRLGVIR